ncbi:MAG: hypothetical protein E7112_00420 [Bacteroidales bacterium]|jgi:hypothetical protein|nr:hypothetical protein [Bacteroidales bacterium]
MTVISNAFKDTVQFKIWKYLIGGVGPIVAVLTIGQKFFNLTILQSSTYGILGVIACFFAIFMWYFLTYTSAYVHNCFVDSIWGDAIKILLKPYSEVHKLERKEEVDDADFMSVLILFCNSLKKIFDKKTKGNTSVSIKVLVSKDTITATNYQDVLEFKNLCRDTEHNDRNTEAYKSIKHTLLQNTPYIVSVTNLMRNNDNYGYINNNIPDSKHYFNSSKGAHKNGVLPYKSELVYPIVPASRDHNTENDFSDLVGFICIDCDKINVFDEDRYDIPVIKGVADELYNIIYAMNYGQER